MYETEIEKTDNQFHYLQEKAHLDLTQRSKGGIFIYFVVWIITAIWADIYYKNFTFFIINTTIILFIACLRATHYIIVTKKRQANTRKMYNILVSLILIGAVHWGVLSAMIIYNGAFPAMHYIYMILIAAFAIGGTSVLSISRIISIYYPLLIFLPTLVVGGMIGGSENHVLLLLALLAVMYVLEASRVAHNDYHQAIYSHRIAENRAVEMEKISITDPLTKLKNRLYFNEQLSLMWSHCLQNKTPLSLIMLDLDHFKKINDNFGHLVGDECLIRVGQVLSHEIRNTTDTVARFGGEEFIVLLPDTEQLIASKIAHQILQDISAIDYEVNSKKVSIRCSIGVACTIPSENKRRNDLIVAADDALYQAKSKGRDQCYVANELLESLET